LEGALKITKKTLKVKKNKLILSIVSSTHIITWRLLAREEKKK
jgi:hypothetical protein